MPEQFQCPDCGFVVRTPEYGEAIDLARRHRDRKHGEDADEGSVETHVASVSST
ncbi:hypothetical protein SAMN06269185_2519 [Natronoarchaeum philippinense]|uniref:Uncharacterized protein n=1 Tax=Natronoarchaeum philippinense TaxID=558529 RepID=A0A285P1E4_NATPI|nr:hypothetical protein [Natronoarchaeum philippinense]SNZ15564.1 hypothetical protein SAMN06269185_2519 [Natronoarchaeum philippinense]